MSQPKRVVTDSMLGMHLPDAAVCSRAVSMVLGQNPGIFTGPGTNTYLVGTGRRPLLLDTGQGVDAYIPLLRGVCRETRPAEGLQAIVLTHGHIDHIGGVRGVREAFGELPVLKMPWPGHDPGDIDLTEIGDGSAVETDGATLLAIWTPGHARDHLCYFMEEEKALFTGDVVLGAGTTVIPDDGDLGDYLDSLRRLLKLDMEVIYPAHGPAIRTPHAKIEEYLAHRALREQQILECLGRGAHRVTDVVEQIYTDVPQALHFAAAMSVRAHLRKLEKDGVTVRDADDWGLA